jgi:glycine cleavage system aminomethyltransferase T
LQAAGFDLGEGDAIRVFKQGSRAGDMATFHAYCDGLLILAAPGHAMEPGAQNTPSHLILYIRRANQRNLEGGHNAPDPLADPIHDINIQPGQAKSYEVKKGQFIQIQDIQGRECSDFQAFSLRALDKGIKRDIDPTTTRTLMGSLYPQPGIFGKYWSVDQEPLVEIVQDTCGRHDTFGLACTARYYEDLGYPGHISCSDNMNADLAQYGIRPRGGWPAINFFFNTMLDDTNAIGMDDPWSRPGDYVLLRALTDLICVSTACREKAAVMDLSPLRKYEVTGPDAEELMQACVTRNMKKLSVGQVVYTAMCYEHGGMIDDGTVFRLGDTNFRWIGGNDTSGLWLRQQAEARNLHAWVRNSTDQLHNIAVQGPLSRDILKQVIWTPPTQSTIDDLGWFRFTLCRVGDFDGIPLVVSRTGYSGELGYEVFCHPKHAEAVFDAVWEVGEPMGLTPLGFEALDMPRIEAGLIFADAEFCDRTDPFEAGIGFAVPLKTQDDDFIGRAAIEERKAHPQRKLVGLQIESGIVPAGGDCVRLGKAQIGEITSAMRSPILGKTIALARLDMPHTDPGTAVEVGQLDGQQKRLRATIVPHPHFDPTKERVKGNYG